MEIPHRELLFSGQASASSLLLKRNCSISPSGLWRVFALIALATLGIGVGFACLGAWLILPFAGLELLVMAVAFVVAGRHATDCERIEFAAGRVRVEVTDSDRFAMHEFEASRVKLVQDEGRAGMRLWLGARDARLEIGRHLDEGSRAMLAVEMRRRLRSN